MTVATITKIWHRYSPLLHLAILLVTLGATYGIAQAAISGQGLKIERLETRHDTLADAVASVKTDTAVTKQQVSDIKESISDIKQALNIPQKHR